MQMDEAVDRAVEQAALGFRHLLGLVGPPGVGKSTLAALIQQRVGDAMVVVGMDGFHLANAELYRLDRHERKGALDTFDVDGYAALLTRLRNQSQPLYAPRFDRDLEESIGSAVRVDPSVSLVVTEGNYLLHDEFGWGAVRPLLDEVWYLDLDDDERRARLIKRRLGHGDTREHAEYWVWNVDEPNAALIAGTRQRADAVVTME